MVTFCSASYTIHVRKQIHTGFEANIEIQARDKQGNIINDGSSGIATLFDIIITGAGFVIRPEVKFYRFGIYTSTFVPTVSTGLSPGLLSITYLDEHIEDSPWNFTISPGTHLLPLIRDVVIMFSMV